MSRAVLAFGSNLGDRCATLREALAGLGPALMRASGGYETPPWGDADQPAYVNAVALVEDPAMTASGWLDLAHQLESAAGRVRDPERRFGPRTLDVDVLAVWQDDLAVVQDDPVLTLRAPARPPACVRAGPVAGDRPGGDSPWSWPDRRPRPYRRGRSRRACRASPRAAPWVKRRGTSNL
ncbi:2-amino-4-hydroxy-6-hydroxymethyldihydropteridine diphosphokinase [Fodinicola feengrottensis]|uniref:2-amino-4-hydroxy-6- hydroxymethyldihydropteridine diphosphokinase n=1 Tax=Fodinicola feengrottensis TaxID=435914 RepID=UPI002442B228|nr:2-amino-4-hydroxy-6-hydroxymethyldihydropteridine diphosphokinase [Fodinicola feengrottensis]